MAESLQIQTTAGINVYAVVRNSVGQAYRADTSVFENYATANLTLTKYAIAMAQQGTASGYYTVAFPVLAAGVYSVVIKQRSSTNPAESDVALGVGDVQWDGTAIVPLAAIPDKTLRRTMANVFASGYGDTLTKNSLYGFIQQGQKWSVSGTVQTVLNTDGSTLGTFTLTAGVGADPIIGVG